MARIRLEYSADNVRGQSIFNVRADGVYLGQVCEVRPDSFVLWVGFARYHAHGIHNMMEAWRKIAETLQ